MASVSYEDALQFRKNAGAPLTWDEDVHPPPRDRIEFTRFILETAAEAGFEVGSWESRITFKGLEEEKATFEERAHQYTLRQKRMTAFQKQIHQHTFRQYYDGIPTMMENTKWVKDGSRRLEWGEYIEQLEKDYYVPWKTSWQFGAKSDSADTILAMFKEHLAKERIGFSYSSVYSYNPKYPKADKITGREVIARYVSMDDAYALERVIYSTFDFPVALVENVPERQILLLYGPVGVIGLVAVIIGAILGYYSGWWLFLFIPAVIVSWVIGGFYLTDVWRHQWVDRRLTFNELTQRIVETKRNEWRLIQEKYKVR